MGANCLGCPSQIKKKPKYSVEPSDTSEYNPTKLNYKLRKLNFKGQIGNVEIINYPYDIISIHFVIFDVFQCSLPRQKKNNDDKFSQNGIQIGISNKIKWKFQSKFEFKMNEYEIRKKFIKISILNQSTNFILQENINLYQIITGPYHHDIALTFQNKTISRLLFDLKISQKFKILVNPLEISAFLNQQYPGQEFNYSFNAYSCGQKVCSSEGSMPQKVNIFSNYQGSYRQLKPEDQCQSPTRIGKGTNFNKVIKNTMISGLKWTKPKQLIIRQAFKDTQDLEQQDLNMPYFKFQMNSNQVTKSSIQFMLWKIEFNKSLGSNQAILFSDCYIPFSRLLQNDYLSVQQLEPDFNQEDQNQKKLIKKFENRICIIQQSLIRDGRSVGRLSAKLSLINQTYFTQLSLHARTEDGIVYMNSMFKNYIGKQNNLLQTDTIIKIQSSFQRIITNFYNINNLKSQRKRNWTQYNIMEEKALQQLNILINLLTSSIQQSLVLGRKHNIQEIIEKQNVFLNILQKIHFFLQEEKTTFIQQIWIALLLIMKRGQFYLQNIGFGQFDRNNSSNLNIQKSNDTSQPSTSLLYPKKIRTALRYQQMLYKILIISLNYSYQNQRDTIIQAQAFKAYGYFRVPKFREQVLKYIVKANENIDFADQAIQTLQQEAKRTNTISKFEQKSSSHLDWESNFYFYLKHEKKSNDLNLILTQHLQGNLWFESIAQRKQSFYIFIEYFTKKMAELGKRLKLIQYTYCPGYNKLVKTFLVEMKKKSIIQYQACMIQTSTILLANHNLINVIIPLVVQKTNIYDSASLNQFLNIFSNYLKFLTQNATKTISEKFNHYYFFKIIKIILESQYSYAISKMLAILHTYFQCFNDQFKDIFCLYLLSKAFFRLFFHWSFSIRIIFYHLFIIKIYWSKLNGVTEKVNRMDTYQNENCQIYNRYKKLIKILNTAERQKNIKKKNMKRAEKEEYFIKMKRKISNKIKLNPQASKLNKQSQEEFDKSSQSSNGHSQNLNLTRLKTLCQLKDRYNRSETLCSTEIQQHLRKLQSEKQICISFNQCDSPQKDMTQQESQDQEFDKLGIKLKTKVKRKSSKMSNMNSKNKDDEPSVKEQIQKINEEYIKRLSLTGHKASSNEEKPLVYTFFGNQDYQLEQISLNQQNKVLLGMQQFRQTQQFVQKYILQKGVAPHVNLDPQIQLDTNEFKMLEVSTL